MIIYLIGLIASVWCVLDVFKKDIAPKYKIGVSLLILVTSWVGLIIYIFFAKDKLTEWCK